MVSARTLILPMSSILRVVSLYEIAFFSKFHCIGCGNKGTDAGTDLSGATGTGSMQAGHDGKHEQGNTEQFLLSRGLEPKPHSWTLGKTTHVLIFLLRS